MRIFNEDKTIELNRKDCDFKKGSLKEDVLTTHHDAVESVEEVGHYEVIREYPNGGKDVKWIVDVEGVEGHDAYDEIEQIQVYVPYSENRLRAIELEAEMSECEDWLSAHDYIGTKIATGRATIEEYADVIAEMNVKADRINEIKEELSKLNQVLD